MGASTDRGMLSGSGWAGRPGGGRRLGVEEEMAWYCTGHEGPVLDANGGPISDTCCWKGRVVDRGVSGGDELLASSCLYVSSVEDIFAVLCCCDCYLTCNTTGKSYSKEWRKEKMWKIQRGFYIGMKTNGRVNCG
jgi:hypothetical protein